MEVVLLEQRGLPDRRLDQRLGRGLAVLLEQPLVERAGVDADPDRGAVVLRGRRDLLDLVVELADVARVDPDRGAAGVDRGEDVLRLEVDVGDDRDLRVLRDLRQRLGVVLRRAGHPHDVAAGRGQLGDLLERGVDVGGERRRHRLDRDRGVAADADLAHLDLAGLAARREHRRGCRGHPQVDLGHGFSVRRRRTPPRIRAEPASRCRCRGTTRSPTIRTTLIDEQARRHDVGDRQQPRDVDVARVGPAAQPREPAPDRLPERAGDVAAVERQQRDEVEQRR